MTKAGKVLLFSGLIFLIMWFISFRVLSENILPFVWVLLGLGSVCMIMSLIVDRKFFGELLGQRSTKHGLNMGVLVLIVIAIVGMVNFVGFRHVKIFDLTKEGRHSLSDQTKKVLKGLDSDLEVLAFYAKGQGDVQAFKGLMDLAKAQTSKIKVTIVDPVSKPGLAKENNITTSGTIVLKYKDKEGKFDKATEEGLANAVIKITRDKKTVVYFVTGHGEVDLNSSEPTGAQYFKQAMEGASYQVKTLSFLETQTVPEDATMVIVAGPKQAYLKPEVKALKDYIYGGGRVFFALDPGTRNNLGKLVSDLGVVFENNYILDPMGQLVGGSPATAIGTNYSKTSPVTKSFTQGMTVFHLASQIKEKQPLPTGFTVDKLVRSSPQSFEKNSLGSGRVRFVEGKDEKGPLTIVASVKGTLPKGDGAGEPKEFTAIVAGNSSFLTNQLFKVQLNQDLVLNSASFLADDTDLVSIRPKSSKGDQLTITKTQATLLFYGLMFIMPLMIFSAGGVVWYRRRTA